MHQYLKFSMDVLFRQISVMQLRMTDHMTYHLTIQSNFATFHFDIAPNLLTLHIHTPQWNNK